MSAIAGAVNLDGNSVDEATLKSMMAAVQHRGPDGQGHWVVGSVGLGHMRLVTTPESRGEIQPAKSHDGEIVLVWDGRIDNREDLVKSLGDATNISINSPDSELVVSAYLNWGDGFVNRIIGDFAFGLWDDRSKTLLLGRDPIGVRLVHYYVDDSILIFGTEIKQLLAHPRVHFTIDEDTVGYFLAGHPTFGDRTFYKGIRRLEGGKILTLSGRSAAIQTYWSPDPADEIRYRDQGEYSEQFASILTTAVRSRLRSSSKIEVLLSGGLDSGSVASVAGLERESNGSIDLEARYWKPPVSVMDEEPYVDAIADQYDFPVNKVDVSDYWAMRQPYFPVRRDEPFTLPFEAMNCEGLRQSGEQGMRVVLTGEGGDEAFTPGYMLYLRDWLKALKWVTLAKDLKKGTKSYRREALRTLVRPMMAWRHNSNTVKWSRIPNWINTDFSERTYLPDRLYDSRVHKYKDRNYVTARGGTAFTIGGDQRAAAFGVELRHPFWDSRLVDFMVRIPPTVRVAGGRQKVLLKKSMFGVMPDLVLNRGVYGAFGRLFDKGFLEKEIDRLRGLAQCKNLEEMGFVDGKKSLQAFDSFISNPGLGLGRIFWTLQAEEWLQGLKADKSSPGA